MVSKFYYLIICLFFFHLSSFAQVPTSGMIASYPFAGNANDTVSGRNGSVGAGAVLCPDRFGNLNNAYQFSGANNSYIEIPITGFNNNEFTYSLWAKVTVLPSVGDQYILLSVGGSGGDQHIASARQRLGFNGWVWGSYNNTSPATMVNTQQDSDLIAGKWAHVVVTRSATKSKLYLDGVQIDEDSIPASVLPGYGTGSKIRIGMRINATFAYKGIIDDVIFYDRAISATEVEDIYNSQTECTLAFTSNPVDSTTATSTQIITLSAIANDTTAAIKWQYNNGTGFTDLVNGHFYDGVSSNNLNITAMYSMNGYLYRAIATSNFCKDTSTISVLLVDTVVHDTVFITIYDTITTVIYDTVKVIVTDTLLINIKLTQVNNNLINTVKIYPNPASNNITVNVGDLTLMSGYRLKITNTAGQQVYNNLLNQQETSIDLSSWSGVGTYLVIIEDASGDIVDVKKIIVQ